MDEVFGTHNRLTSARLLRFPAAPEFDSLIKCQVGKGSRLRRPLVAYLQAQLQALVADSGATGRCHGRDLVAALAAEAALFRRGLIMHLLDDRRGCAGRPAGTSQHLVHAAHAVVADGDARPGDQVLSLFLLLPAERAGCRLTRPGGAAPDMFGEPLCRRAPERTDQPLQYPPGPGNTRRERDTDADHGAVARGLQGELVLVIANGESPRNAVYFTVVGRCRLMSL
jgi:hypothetical protein